MDKKQMTVWVKLDYNDETTRPKDRHWVLIAHKDYLTPIKAKFRAEAGGIFQFDTPEGRTGVFLAENKVSYWTYLPALPDDYLIHNPLKEDDTNES